jgi:hypothetical protein
MAAQANRWSLGTMYYQGLLNGQPFFTQPGGPGTQVFPTQANATPWAAWPAAGVMVLQEYSPWWAPGCGHSVKTLKVIREFDYETNSSVALVCCEICSYLQRTIEPFEEWLNPIENAILIA